MFGRQDYLSAPMPFLMGVHAPNLFMSTLRSSAMEEVVVVDLDGGTTTASSLHAPRRGGDVGGGAGSALPWGRQLEAALALLKQTLRSPIEYESTPVIAALMQARPAPAIHPLPCLTCASLTLRELVTELWEKGLLQCDIATVMLSVLGHSLPGCMQRRICS